jgi:hypothetical protein
MGQIKIPRITTSQRTGGSGLTLAAGELVYDTDTGYIYKGDGSTAGGVQVDASAVNVTVADESSDTTCFPLFATAATGDLSPKSGSNLTFNSSSGLLTATLLAGDLTGDVTGNADTVTTNANLTGEVTSSGNATTIADNIVDEANLKVSNAPTNGYFLSAQSGDTGGLTWAAAGGGSGDITSVVAGAGMTGGATSGDATLNVIGGDGITANADDIAVTAAQTAVTSMINASLTKIGTATDQEYVTFGTANEVNTFVNNTERHSVTASGVDITGALTVTHDYDTVVFETQLDNNDGNGEILRYGTAQEGPAGTLHFLHTDGTWDLTDANAVADGGSQLLGIALGSDPGVNGMLLNGYIRIEQANIDGTPAIGAPVYVADDATGEFDFTAPVGAADFVRIIGYCIDIESDDILLRFDPSDGFIVLA